MNGGKSRDRRACWLVLLVAALLSGCQPAAAGSEEPAASEGGESEPASEASFAAPVPQRPRFQHVPRAYSTAKVQASKIELAFVDSRANVRPAQLMLPALAQPQAGETVEVALPAGFEALVRERLDRIVGDSGPVLTFRIEIKKLSAGRTGDVRRLDIDLAVTVEDSGGRVLVQGSGNGNKELLGPPYDNAELDDLHRAACLDAIDVFLASEANIGLINQHVGHTR